MLSPNSERVAFAKSRPISRPSSEEAHERSENSSNDQRCNISRYTRGTINNICKLLACNVSFRKNFTFCIWHKTPGDLHRKCLCFFCILLLIFFRCTHQRFRILIFQVANHKLVRKLEESLVISKKSDDDLSPSDQCGMSMQVVAWSFSGKWPGLSSSSKKNPKISSQYPFFKSSVFVSDSPVVLSSLCHCTVA